VAILALVTAYSAAWLLAPGAPLGADPLPAEPPATGPLPAPGAEGGLARRAGGDGEAVAAEEWFGAAQLDRMRDFRGPQRLLGLAGLLLELALLTALAIWAPPRIARLLRRGRGQGEGGERHIERGPGAGHGRRAWCGPAAAALVAAGIALAAAVVALPLGVFAAERARDAGLLTQPPLAWLGDRAREAAIAVALAALAGTLAIALIRRLGRWWWLGGSTLVVLYAVFIAWLAPIVIAPLFNEFEPLPDGEARTEIISLADRAGVEADEILVVDAGRRSTAINAYVTGLGPSKRIVVYDNALDGLRRDALRSVLAHELAHVEARDVPRGVLWVALVAPLGMLFVQGAGARLAQARGVEPGSPAAIPGLALCLALAVLMLGVPAAHLSRQVEARADRFALELSGEPRALIELQRDLARTNLSDPDPPALWHFLFATHPSTVERIGTALEYGRDPLADRRAADRRASAARRVPTARRGPGTRAGS